MKRWQLFTTLGLGVVCLVLSLALITMAYQNRQLQQEIQERQAKINSGVLGPQAQQIAGSILQEMIAVSETNPRIRALLKTHGYAFTEEVSEAPAEAVEEPAEVVEEPEEEKE